MQYTLPDGMEPTNQSTSNKENETETSEQQTELFEIASDRESSIESFHTNKSEISITTETELIDVDDIELSDEESWLYKSPKKLSANEKAISTYNWLHKDVENMDDMELQATKTALVSKLNQIKFHNSDWRKMKAKETASMLPEQTCDINKISSDKSEVNQTSHFSYKSDVVNTSNNLSHELTISKEESHSSAVEDPRIKSVSEKINDENSEHNPKEEKAVLDVMDVQKMARLQEESLKKSTSRFLSHIEKKPFMEQNIPAAMLDQGLALSKPASVEALNTCAGKLSHSGVYALVPMQGMKKQSMFGSSVTLSHNQELHRGSLPNINKGYYSLRSKKSKRPSDQKMPCPLPIYPSHTKLAVNGTNEHVSYESQCKMLSPNCDYRESRTLPSSYRVHSRSNSSSRRDLNALSPSSRRESSPFLANQKISHFPDASRRDSAPCNARRFVSPSSPSIYHRSSSSSPLLQSPTKASNYPPQNLRSPPSVEYHRNASHSPSRRLPLTTVHNHSPKRGNSPAPPRNGDFRAMKMPSKIPSPASRSGIPVPSIPCISRANAEDDSWSQDCF